MEAAAHPPPAVAARGRREAFLNIAAHELGSSVTTVAGYVDLLRRQQRAGQLDDGRLDRYLDRLETAVERLVATTRNLIGVTDILGQTPPPGLQLADLAVLVEDAVHIQQLRLRDATRLTLTAAEGPAPVLVDFPGVKEAILHLLENAVKFSPAGGPIAATLVLEEGAALLRVRDAGIGLPAGAADSIFEPFVRAANAERLVIPGLGLGLFRCRAVVEAHGGQIGAESAGEGEGAEFWLRLPLAGANGTA